MTGYKQLCAELVDELEGWVAYGDEIDIANAHVLIDRARAALAEPEPEGPTDEKVMELMPQQMHEDLAFAVQAMAEQAGTDSTRVKGAMRIALNRHIVDLARTVLARWGRSAPEPMPEPPTPSDEELMALAVAVFEDQFATDKDYARAVLARWGK